MTARGVLIAAVGLIVGLIVLTGALAICAAGACCC